MPSQKSDLDRWADAASKIESVELPPSNLPLHVLFGEAVDVARFAAKYWEPERDAKKRVVRRGLVSAIGEKSRLYEAIADDILSLQRAGQDAHTRYLLTVSPGALADPTERGRFLLDEITATLEWYFDDGVEDENDAKLSALGSAHADDPQSADALAGALDDYAVLAEPHRDAIDGLGGFDVAHIDEARVVARALREKPATPAPTTLEAKRAIALRNKVATLLWERMSIVRAAARFVFRGQPEIVREATSAYERRRRAAARRAKATKEAEGKKPPTE
ncbi:Hypothetical protein A7982_11814 [Minicystis rosea]|nr:Hypothetical protein A7982_11814 [Minicystis rosea]